MRGSGTPHIAALPNSRSENRHKFSDSIFFFVFNDKVSINDSIINDSFFCHIFNHTYMFWSFFQCIVFISYLLAIDFLIHFQIVFFLMIVFLVIFSMYRFFFYILRHISTFHYLF